MFFKKRREEKKAVAERAKKQVLDAFQLRIDEASRMPSIEEKIIKLEEVQRDVDAFVKLAETNLKEMAVNKGKNVFAGVTGASAAIGMGAVVFVSAAFFPAALMLVYTGMMSGILAGAGLSGKSEKDLFADNKDFFKNLEGKKTAAASAMKDVVVEQFSDLAQSAGLEDILNKFPDVKARFAEVAAKKLASGEIIPKPPKRGFNL